MGRTGVSRRGAIGVWLRGRRLVLASVVGFLLIAGGVAYATIPDTGTGLIHGCYNKSTGALRVIDPSKGQKCASTEAALNWNQRGINWRGTWSSTASYAVNDAVALNDSSWLATVANSNSKPPSADWALLAKGGAKGATGLTGSTGPAGISTGVSVTTGTSVPLTKAQNLTTVMTMPGVPVGGDYYINASVMLVVAQGDTVTCILSGSNSGTFGAFATVGPAANQTYETLPLAGDVALSAGDAVSVQCADYTSNASTSFYNGAMTGTLIGSDNAASALKRHLGASRGATRLPKLPAAIGPTAR